VTQQYWRERGCAVVVFEGTYAPEEGLAAIEAALGGDAGVSTGLLLDMSESESFRARSVDGLRRVVDFLASRRGRFNARLATVGGTDLAFGLLRMATVFASDQGIETEAFRTRAEALDWLDCDSSRIVVK
jgi:hypothetical protein